MKKTVYDIKNCGPRHRFVVRSKGGGTPMIVHNCNQALAFAVMKHQARLISKRYQIVLNTHDEWGIVVKDQQVEDAKEYMQWCLSLIHI